MTAVSQWEREAIGGRTRDALAHKRSKGERLGNMPYGYKPDMTPEQMISSLKSDKSSDDIYFQHCRTAANLEGLFGGICPFLRESRSASLDELRAGLSWTRVQIRAGSGNRGVTVCRTGGTIPPLPVVELKRVVDREPVCNRGDQFDHPDARSGFDAAE
jgi:hypothetical protein